jgi:hypothetical protein
MWFMATQPAKASLKWAEDYFMSMLAQDREWKHALAFNSTHALVYTASLTRQCLLSSCLPPVHQAAFWQHGRSSYSRGSKNRSQLASKDVRNTENVTVAKLRGFFSHAFEHPVSEDRVDPVDRYY